MKKNLIFLILFLLILVSFSFFFGLYEVRFFKSRASVSQASFSVDNSIFLFHRFGLTPTVKKKFELQFLF